MNSFKIQTEEVPFTFFSKETRQEFERELSQVLYGVKLKVTEVDGVELGKVCRIIEPCTN